MVKYFIFGAFHYTVTIGSTRPLLHLFHWGSGSNGLVATGQGSLDTNEMQMAVVMSKINEFQIFL